MTVRRASPLTWIPAAGADATSARALNAARGARQEASLIGAAALLKFVADLDADAATVLRDHVLDVLGPAGIAVPLAEQVEHTQRQAGPGLPVAGEKSEVGDREPARRVAGQGFAGGGVLRLETGHEPVVAEGDAQVGLRQ